MKALAEHSANSSIRRALLRKTRNQQDLQVLQPGQAVAFWRWSGRSRQHKKGAWALARFISHDPDGKSIWVQVNTTTVKVANNQVRLACGWEEWTPSREDIAMLKDAEANVRQDLWEDGREEPPGALEEATSELAGHVLDAPAPLLPRPADYCRFTDYEAIRVHLVPRHDLYVPTEAECEFNPDDLDDLRKTYIHEHDEQPSHDQWRDPRCTQTWEHPWTGNTSFRWKTPAQVPPPGAQAPPPLPLRLPAQASASSLGRAAAPRQQTNVQQELRQTNVHHERHQSDVRNQKTSVKTYIDNRSVTVMPSSPVPPTPRSRARLRSRTPTGRQHGHRTKETITTRSSSSTTSTR